MKGAFPNRLGAERNVCINWHWLHRYIVGDKLADEPARRGESRCLTKRGCIHNNPLSRNTNICRMFKVMWNTFDSASNDFFCNNPVVIIDFWLTYFWVSWRGTIAGFACYSLSQSCSYAIQGRLCVGLLILKSGGNLWNINFRASIIW